MVIFRGEVDDQKVVAFSVAKGTDPASLRELAPRSGRVVLVYEDYAKASSVEPLAVLSGREVAVINDGPLRTATEPTVEDLARAANVAGPKKLGAVCQDGTRISPSGRSQVTQMASLWRSCSKRGGLERWFRSSTRDEDAVVATICSDYRLVAGRGDACGRSGWLVRVRNHKY